MTRPRSVVITVAVACFALAAGVALGTGPLRGDEEGHLRARVDELQGRVASMQDRAEHTRRVEGYRDAYAAATSPDLVGELLTGRSVVLVRLPGSPAKSAEAIATTISDAGGSVTGTVRIKPKWGNPHQRQFLEDLTSRLVTSDVQLPARGSAYDRAGTLLARALVTGEPDAAGKSDQDSTMILQGYRAGGLLAVDAGIARADLAVVVAPPAGDGMASDGSGDTDGSGSTGGAGSDAALAAAHPGGPWLALARALDAAGQGVVVAGDPSCADRGVIAALRASPDAAADVSSVDVAGLPGGRVATVRALAEQYRGGSGQYGVVQAADGAFPALAGANG